MLSSYLPQLSVEEDEAARAAFAGRLGVKVVSGGQEFLHPRAGWKFQESNGWLAITSPKDHIVAIYREWESIRMYGGNLTLEDLRAVGADGISSSPVTEPRHPSLVSAALVACWLVLARRGRKQRGAAAR